MGEPDRLAIKAHFDSLLAVFGGIEENLAPGRKRVGPVLLFSHNILQISLYPPQAGEKLLHEATLLFAIGLSLTFKKIDFLAGCVEGSGYKFLLLSGGMGTVTLMNSSGLIFNNPLFLTPVFTRAPN